jgi:CDP-diacylglycerol--glycerol-3-phosphate 3-phosphatidyltransferase
VSVLRVGLAPFLVVLVVLDRPPASIAAAAVFVAGAVTDGLDGYLARRYRSRTRTGQWLDPLADKVLVLAPVVALTAVGRFPLWAAAVIAAREGAMVWLRAFMEGRGRSMPASVGAKAKTTLQLVAITLYLLPLGPGWEGPRLWVLGAAVAVTVATGVHYGVRAAALVRGDRPPGAPG